MNRIQHKLTVAALIVVLAGFLTHCATPGRPLQLRHPSSEMRALEEQKSEIVSAPLCPENSQILPDTYPAMAVSVSDEAGPKFVSTFVEKSLLAQPLNPPQFLLNVTAETYGSVVDHVDKLAKTDEQRQKWLSALSRVESAYRTNWQQDYYQGSFDAKTGLPILRFVKGYEDRGQGTGATVTDLFAEIVRQMSAHGIWEGSPIGEGSASNRRLPSGAYGGNLEAAPPGICVVGDGDFRDEENWMTYAQSGCGNASPLVKAPTSWLAVGHTDEIFQSVPLPTQAAPCNFALALASPRKAVELLKQAPQERAFDLPQDFDQKAKSDFFRSGVSHPLFGAATIDQVCGDYLDAEAKRKGRKDWWSAAASTTDWSACAAITNQQLLAQVESFGENLNARIQDKLDEFRSHLKTAVRERLPTCQLDFIEVPNLFWGTLDNAAQKKIGRAQAGSIFPNPTNAVILGTTNILPYPFNRAFKDYLSKEYTKRGIQVDFVDTLYAHRRKGNLHCSTQVIRYCRPRD